jgi:hypothetical protein
MNKVSGWRAALSAVSWLGFLGATVFGAASHAGRSSAEARVRALLAEREAEQTHSSAARREAEQRCSLLLRSAVLAEREPETRRLAPAPSAEPIVSAPPASAKAGEPVSLRVAGDLVEVEPGGALVPIAF